MSELSVNDKKLETQDSMMQREETETVMICGPKSETKLQSKSNNIRRSDLSAIYRTGVMISALFIEQA